MSTAKGLKPFGSLPGEALIVERILKLRADHTFQEIADELNAENLVERRGPVVGAYRPARRAPSTGRPASLNAS